MSTQPLDIRMARLEGAYEQIDHRLADLRRDLDRHFAGIDQHFASIDQRFGAAERRMEAGFTQIDQKFMWVIGVVAGTWITTILTVLFHR